MGSKYLDAYLQQKASKKKDEEKNSTSSTGRGAGSAAASGNVESKNDFMDRVRKETRNLYSQAAQPERNVAGGPMRNLYSQAVGSGPSGTPAPTYQQPNLYSQAARTPTPGMTGAQRQMIAERENKPAVQPSYFQILERNINAAAADPESVTPAMVAELREADRQRTEERRQNFRQLEQEIAAQENPYSQAAQAARTPTPGLTGAQRQMIAEKGEALPEDADLREVKARLPGLQHTYEAAKNNYQQLMDRNIRLANETGEVSPEQVAELWRAEQAMNQAQQRYNDALARNEQMSYAEKMGNTQTDLANVGALLVRRDEIYTQAREHTGNWQSRQELVAERDSINQQIDAVEQSLRAEGYSDEEIRSLFAYLTRQQNEKDTEERKKSYRTAAKDRGWLGNLGINTGTGLLSGVGYLDLAMQNLLAGQDAITGQRMRVDYNTGAQNPYHMGEATMQGEMDKLLERYGVTDEEGNVTGMSKAGNIRAGAYQLAASLGQSGAVAGLTAMGVPAAMLLLSGSAATSTAHEMHEKGFSDGSALVMGVISGAAEYVTEKIGMDELFKTRDISTAKNVVKTLLGNIVNQSMAEGGEEVLSTVINTLADLLVNQDKSELALRYRELLAQGMTPEEAERAAAREWMQGAWQDFYMGALSGGLFGMGGTAFVSGKNAITDARTGRQIIDAGTVQDVLEAAKKLDGKISDAAAMPEISDTPSARELGAAQRGLKRAQVMENMRSELESRGEENVSPELLSALYNSSLKQEQRLTREEQKALRGSRTAMELAAEWSEQWGDNSVPAPFEGMEDILRRQMEEKENAPQEGAEEAREQQAAANTESTEKQRVTEILSGTMSNSRADAIASDPALREAFTAVTGIELKGTKSAMRNAVKEYARQVETIIDTDPATHTPEQQQIVNEYVHATDKKIIKFLDKLRSLKDKKISAKLNHTISQVSDNEVAAIYSITGVDTTGYSHNLNGENLLLHILPEHGENGTTDQSMRYDADVARIGYVLSNYDSITQAHEKDGREMRNTKYLDANGKHPPVIVYTKRLDGTYYVISAVAETKAKKIHVISAYIGPQTEIGVPEFDSGTPVKDPRMFDAEAPNFTPEAAYASSSTDSIRDSGEKSNTQNEGRASAEVTTGANSKENRRPAYTVHDGVGKLFADQLDRLTEMADRQGTYYDGVQETLTDALLEAESENDLDRILAGKDSDKFSYSPELTEKLWELRQLIDVKGKNTEAARPVTENTRSVTENAQTSTENAQTETKDRRSLEQQLQELKDAYQAASDRNDTEFDYRGTLQKITELEKKLGDQKTEEKIPHQSADSVRDDGEGENDTSSAEQSSAPSPQGEGSEMEAARAELLEVGEATVRNDTGTYIMKVRLKGDRYQAQIFKNGKLDKSQSFPSAQEAADYAVDWVKGRTEGQTDAELDSERSEQREKPGPHWPTGKEYGEEIVRQKQNKAADAATQTLRERIRRAEAELQALRRLDRNTGLTDRQKARMNDIQETLDIMNDELTARKGRRAEKKNKARQTPVTENKPTRSAAEAKNALMDLFHTAAGNRAEAGRQIEAKLAEIAQSGRITEESRQQLYDMLMDNGMVPKHAEETFREIRNWLRGTRIFVNEQERADLGDNFEDLRKRAWGAGIYLTNDLRDGRIDAINGQLAETFGENRFPTDNALSDMLENMIDLADKGKTTQQTMQEAVEGEARETGQSANEIYADMFNRMDETLRTFAEKAGLEVDLKNRTATQLAQERQRWEDRMERKAQARRESEIRGKVLRGLQRLSKLRGKAGPEIRADIDEVLQDIDTQARQITPAGLENLQDLQRAYEEARAAAGYVDGDNMGNWIPNPYVEEKLASLTKKHVNDMSLEEVVDLGRTVEALEHAIRTQNQMIGEEFDATIESYANGVRGDVESSKGAKAGFLHKWLKEEHLSPRRFLDMLGGWTDGSMKKLSQSLESGQTRMLDFQRRATQSFDSFLSRKANRQWLEKASGKKAEWTKYTVLDGYSEDGGSYTEIELTPMMKISLYLHSRNMDNLRHIQTGGIVIPNKALYQQGKMAEAYAQGKRVKMNPETVRKIAGELTETERTFANHMITFFDQISKDAINKVSLQLDGFERAGVENYMPIETDRNFLKSDVAGEARAQTVEGIGSIANERIHASNPVMLSDASDVLMRQIDKVGRYYGYAIPIRNFQAVNNYVFHEEGAPFSTSVKEIMNKKWGAGAEQYITKMLEDLQSSGRRGDMMSSALAKLRGNLAGATLMFNPSVAVSQTASYPGAAQAVGWDGLAHGLTAGRVDPKLIEKYTPLYWYRNQGNSTQELGDYMSDKGMAQKLPWILNWIQKMDSATIRRLWAASEYRVSKDNPGLKPGSKADIDAGTDAYYKKVAEVFNRAVYDTQPNYTNMERAQILRSNSDLTKFLTMYKTVPLQYYGMMVEATGRLQAAVKSGDQTKIAEARKYAANTFGGLLAANTVYVAMKALFKGIRRKDKDYRDEEGNLTAGSVAAQLGKDLAETYAGSIIGGAEMYSAAESLLTGSKFYGPEMSALSYVEDMVNAVGKVASAIGEEDPRQAAGALKDAALTLAKGFGVPAENMETYLMAGVRWMFPDVAMEYDNMFGGIDRADMKGMDEQAVSTATNLILQNRTGLKIDKSVTDELARLYAAGENAAVPTETPSSFTYNGKTVEISDRGAYSDTWGGIVGDNLEALVTADDYVAYNDEQRAALVNKLYQYATVEARREADPDYSADGNSTYGWTVKADEAVEAGVDLVDAICALSAFGYMNADKDEFGNSISGSKKEKVCHYIDAMNITTRQKNVMYLLAGYKENSLEYTPWHGKDEIGYVTADREKSEKSSGRSTGKSSGRSSGKSSGKKRSGGRGGSRKAAAPKEKAVKGSGLKLPKASSGSGGAGTVQTPKGSGKGTDASLSLIEIIDKFYGGNALAAAMDGGARARGRTEVDFEL